jgi:hypothetical protein
MRLLTTKAIHSELKQELYRNLELVLCLKKAGVDGRDGVSKQALEIAKEVSFAVQSMALTPVSHEHCSLTVSNFARGRASGLPRSFDIWYSGKNVLIALPMR